jgi:hypothetical protein
VTLVRNGAKLLTALAFLVCVQPAPANPRTAAWQKEELNEKFMRALTKAQCMAKTIATLEAGCSDAHCLKTLAGISGDCVTWAIGEKADFCASYDREYTGSYCATNELDGRRCGFLYIGKQTFCPSK